MAPSKQRYATCGACGSEQPVTPFMVGKREHEFTHRPGQPTDSFYCGCENQGEGWGWIDE